MAMRRAALIAILLALPACGAHGQTGRDAAANVMRQLKSEMVGKVQLDGGIIKDIRPAGPCRSTFVTSRGTAVIDWSKVGNPAGRLVNGRQVTAFNGGSGVHRLSAPVGPLTENVSASTDVLIGECQSK